VALETPAETTTLPFAHGYYIVSLPGSEAVGSLPTGGPYSVVGYDRKGEAITKLDLDAIVGERPE
jgi:hypothetical protein